MLSGLMIIISFIGRTKPQTGMETGTSPPANTTTLTTPASTGVSKSMNHSFKDGEATVPSTLSSQLTSHNINQSLKFLRISTKSQESLFKDTPLTLGLLCIMLKFWTQRFGTLFLEMMIWIRLRLIFIIIKLSLPGRDLRPPKMLAMIMRPSFLNRLIDLSIQSGLESGHLLLTYAPGG